MTIVPMQERHLDALAELERLCFVHPWTCAGLAAELESGTALFLAAEDETGEAVGYVGSHVVCGECYIDNVAVHPNCRGQGIALAILTELIRLVREQNGVFLTLEVRESNIPARRLYEKLGFSEAGRRRNFYTDPKEDALLLTLTLTD